MQEELLVAALSRSGGFYNTKLFAIAEVFGSFIALYNQWLKGITEDIPEALSKTLSHAWQSNYLAQTEELLVSHDIKPVLSTAREFPPMLAAITDKPYLIFYKGDITSVSANTCVSMVGTRAMSPYGKRIIGRLIEPLSQLPLTIISGLALGVDGEVHKLCLKSGIKTGAVLAGGLDRYEPLTNSYIGRQIEKEGCLVSEYPPGVRPQKHHFLERNRIIAGLSRGTIVIEGKVHSGSLVTARYALSYGREVGAVPGDVFVASTEGPLRLLRDGGWPIATPEDVAAMLDMTLPSQAANPKDQTPLLRYLYQKSATIDELKTELALPLDAIQQELTLLELEGFIATTAQGEYYLVK